jgi:pyridoxamine 5'-phosphate oxidase
MTLPPKVTGPFDQSHAMAIDQALPDALPPEPFALFKGYFDKAATQKIQPNPNAFCLATIDPEGTPSARIVLCKGIDGGRGHIVFHTNYHGRKGRALAANPRAAVCFHWDDLDVQVRMECLAARSPAAESDAYFLTRPWARRVGAWTSDQSEPIASRAALEAKLEATMRRLGIDPDHPPGTDARIDIPRPPHWGGVRLWAARVEIWLGSRARLHDRAVWTRALEPASVDGVPGYQGVGAWTSTRVQP